MSPQIYMLPVSSAAFSQSETLLFWNKYNTDKKEEEEGGELLAYICLKELVQSGNETTSRQETARKR